MRIPSSLYLSSIFCLLTVFSNSVQAGIFDDLSKGLQKGIKETREIIEDNINKNVNPEPQPARQAEKTAAFTNGSTVTGELRHGGSISRIGGYLKGGQFNSKRDDFGLILELRNPSPRLGSRGCNGYIQEQFGGRNDPALKRLQLEHQQMAGEKVALENVRMAKSGRWCVFSSIRYLRKVSATEQAIAAKGNGLTIGGELTNRISIGLIGPDLNGQFGASYDSHGLMLSLANVKNVALAGNHCNTYLYDRFGKKNDPTLASLRDEYAGVRGKKVVLENVRRVKNGVYCLYSKLHLVDEPDVIPSGSKVSGVVRVLGYANRHAKIPEKMKLGLGRIPVVHIGLSNAKATGFDSRKCKIYYSAIVEEKLLNMPDEIKRLKPNVTRVTLKDVGMLNEKKGECTFDHYKTFNIARVGETAARAEEEARKAGEFSFKYHLPQITAAMEGRSRDEIFSSVNKLKKYGYGVNTNSSRDHVTATGQTRQTYLQISFDRNKQVNKITSNTLIQETMSGCDALATAYANKLVDLSGFKPTKKTKKGQVTRMVKGSSSAVIGYGRQECSVVFTADIGAASVVSNASTPNYAVDNKYAGFKVGVLQLCADSSETINALKAYGYKNVGFGSKIPKSGMLIKKSKRTSQYKYNLLSLQWDKGKITRYTLSIDGEGAYDNLFESERRRIEKATGHKFKCKKDARNHQCLYRDRKTYTNFALNATPRNKNRLGINATSGCK